MDTDSITRSLELAAAHCDDPAPLVYARLFAAHPAMEGLFVRDASGSVRGHMLATAIENVLDFAGGSALATTLIEVERVNHENLGVPREVFPAFFGAMAETFRDLLGADWSPEMAAAWADLLARLNAVTDAT